jgi:Flp pilus assembly pilin Flp
MFTDRRAVTSFEYALLAGALAFVFFEVLQMPADALANVITGLLAGVGGHGAGG